MYQPVPTFDILHHFRSLDRLKGNHWDEKKTPNPDLTVWLKMWWFSVFIAEKISKKFMHCGLGSFFASQWLNTILRQLESNVFSVLHIVLPTSPIDFTGVVNHHPVKLLRGFLKNIFHCFKSFTVEAKILHNLNHSFFGLLFFARSQVSQWQLITFLYNLLIVYTKTSSE